MTFEIGNDFFIHFKIKIIKLENQITQFTGVFFDFIHKGFCLRTLGCLTNLCFQKIKASSKLFTLFRYSKILLKLIGTPFFL